MGSGTYLNLTALDVGVGNASIHYRFDAGAWLLYDGPFTIDENGILACYGVDGLGNRGPTIEHEITLEPGEPDDVPVPKEDDSILRKRLGLPLILLSFILGAFLLCLAYRRLHYRKNR